jgi:hypothetical protein
VGDRIVGNSTTDDYYLAAKFQDRFVKPGPRPEPQAAFSKWAKGAFADFDQFGSMSDFERFAQEIPRWSIFLYKADASYSASVHTGTESSLGQRFPGVGFVDLGGANSSSYLFDYSIRAQHDTRRWQFYLQSDFSYAYKKLRGKTNQYARSEPADYWYEESGMALRLDPRHQNPSGWKLLIPVGFRHQIPPLVQIAPILPNGKSTASSPSPVRQEADLYPAFRPGIRWDYLYPKPNQSAAQERSGASSAGPPQSGTLASYLEAGYQVGELLHSPDGYQFSGGTTCYVETLIPCLTKIGASSIGSTSIVKSVIGGRQHLQDGLYLDFRFDLPIPFFSKVEYVNENRGDFFFGARGDAVVDTRFYDDWRQSLKIPINHKLSIAPTIELILFQNKIAGNFYRDYSTFVALNYSLDWHWKLVEGSPIIRTPCRRSQRCRIADELTVPSISGTTTQRRIFRTIWRGVTGRSRPMRCCREMAGLGDRLPGLPTKSGRHMRLQQSGLRSTVRPVACPRRSWSSRRSGEVREQTDPSSEKS